MAKTYAAELTKGIGEKIKILRKNQGWSQQELSEKTGLSRATISNYEIGRRTPHLSDLQALCSVFSVGLEYFNVSDKDSLAELLARAKEVFENKEIPAETKENLYVEFMKLYLKIKG